MSQSALVREFERQSARMLAEEEVKNARREFSEFMIANALEDALEAPQTEKLALVCSMIGDLISRRAALPRAMENFLLDLLDRTATGKAPARRIGNRSRRGRKPLFNHKQATVQVIVEMEERGLKEHAATLAVKERLESDRRLVLETTTVPKAFKKERRRILEQKKYLREIYDKFKTLTGGSPDDSEFWSLFRWIYLGDPAPGFLSAHDQGSHPQPVRSTHLLYIRPLLYDDSDSNRFLAPITAACTT